MWASIDCPGAYAVGEVGRGEPVLGRMTARVVRLPDEGEPCVVVGWPLGGEGRKLHAGTALYGRAGDVVATGRADPVTILVEPRVAGAAVGAATPPYRQQTALSDAGGRAGHLVAPLIVAAAMLLLVALLLGMLALRPRSTARAREAELVRAVRLLRESARRPVPDRRRAADLVSRVAGSAGADEVAEDASQLAWSASSPKPEGTVALAERAEAGR